MTGDPGGASISSSCQHLISLQAAFSGLARTGNAVFVHVCETLPGPEAV